MSMLPTPESSQLQPNEVVESVFYSRMVPFSNPFTPRRIQTLYPNISRILLSDADGYPLKSINSHLYL